MIAPPLGAVSSVGRVGPRPAGISAEAEAGVSLRRAAFGAQVHILFGVTRAEISTIST